MGHEGDVTSLCIGKMGRFVCSGATDTKVTVWDAQTGIQHCSLSAVGGVLALALNATDSMILASTSDHSMKIWDIDTRRIKVSCSTKRSIL